MAVTPQSQLYTLDRAGAAAPGNYSRADGLVMCQLSDGTLVFTYNNHTSKAPELWICPDHSTPQKLDSFTTGVAGGDNDLADAPGAQAICRNDTDDIFWAMPLRNGTTEIRCYKKAATGYSWTRQNGGVVTVRGRSQPATAGGPRTTTNVRMLWCNTAGGINGRGHLAVFYADVGFTHMVVVDVGRCLQAPGITNNEVSFIAQPTCMGGATTQNQPLYDGTNPTPGGSYRKGPKNPMAVAQDGFGSPQGTVVVGAVTTTGGTSVGDGSPDTGYIVGAWAVGSGGTFTQNISLFLTPIYRNLDWNVGDMPTIVRYGVDKYALFTQTPNAFAGASNSGQWVIYRYSRAGGVAHSRLTPALVPLTDMLPMVMAPAVVGGVEPRPVRPRGVTWRPHLDPIETAEGRIHVLYLDTTDPTLVRKTSLNITVFTVAYDSGGTSSVIAGHFTIDPATGGYPTAEAQNFTIKSLPHPEGGFVDYQVIDSYWPAIFGGSVFYAPRRPGNVLPAQGSIVQTDIPTLSATILVGSTAKAEWQLATDSGFTTNVRTLTEPDADFRASGVTTEDVPTDQQLFQGVWWLRAAAISSPDGFKSKYTPGQSFTVSHKPSVVNMSPTNGQFRDFGLMGTVTFSWDFSDPSPVDSQTAYQYVIERNDTGAVIADTGKVLSPIDNWNINLDASLKEVLLRWHLRVWDSDDVVSDYSPYNLFTLADLAVVAIISPTTGAVVNRPAPTVTWSFTPPAGSGRTQVKYQVLIRRPSDGLLIFDSGLLSGADTSYTPPSPVLGNLIGYTVQVKTVDSSGLESLSSIIPFSTSWPVPTLPSFLVTADSFDTLGYVSVNWLTTPRDATWLKWRVYRKLHTDTLWKLLYETTDTAANAYHDYLASAYNEYDYVVVQVADRFGLEVESNFTYQTITPVATHYWLIHPYDPNRNFLLRQVTADSFTEQFEKEIIPLAGRGNKVEWGTRFGYQGSLSAELRDVYGGSTARAQRMFLESLKREQTYLFLRSPFGDLWQVAPDDIHVTRVPGVGQREFVDVEIPYQEVS